MSKRSKLQQNIISEHQKNDTQRDEEIAVKLDCSSSYVNQTRNEYEQENGSNLWFWIVVGLLVAIVVLGEAGLL